MHCKVYDTNKTKIGLIVHSVNIFALTIDTCEIHVKFIQYFYV